MPHGTRVTGRGDQGIGTVELAVERRPYEVLNSLDAGGAGCTSAVIAARRSASRITPSSAAIPDACKGQEKGKAHELCSRLPSRPHEMLDILRLLGTAPPVAAGMRRPEIGARNELMPWEIWLLSLDSNQEPSG